jgi:hypothetical protein
MEIIATVSTDNCNSGTVAVNEAQQKAVQAIQVSGCNSGLITFVIGGNLYWFVYHEQEATDAIGGVEQQYYNWAESLPKANPEEGVYIYTEFGTSTKLQKKIKKKEDLQKHAYTQPTSLISKLNGQTMTITYFLRGQAPNNILVNDQQWNNFWDSLNKNPKPQEKNKQGTNCCNIF